MSTNLSRWVLAVLVSLSVPAVAHAHARLDAPPARDMQDGYKNDSMPCGIARTGAQPSTMLAAGASVEVKWTETINHPGCFLIDFSSSGDANFQLLANVKHIGTGGTPRPYSRTVTLPTAPCTACTLRLRQIMLGNETATCPPTTIAAGATYYACANVVLTGGADGGVGSGGMTGSGSGGATGSGGRSGSGGNTGSGGMPGSGSGGMIGTGGAPVSGTGGALVGSGGVTGSGTGGLSSPGTGGLSTANTGGTSGTGGAAVPPGTSADPPGCTFGSSASASWPATGLAVLGIFLVLAHRRLRSRNRTTSPY